MSMTYEGKLISDMTEEELNETLYSIRERLARVRGHGLRDRLHRQRIEIEKRLKTLTT